MSKRYKIKNRRANLEKAREIMDSMKTLALMELHRLEGQVEAQSRHVAVLRGMISDFCASYPQARPEVTPAAQSAYLLLGSERGFCGAYNQQLLDAFRESTASEPHRLIASGHKLNELVRREQLDATLIRRH